MRTLQGNSFSISVRYTALVAAMACAFAQDAASATLTVSNINDSGAGSLRQAITDANTNCATDPAPLIQFNLGIGPFVISVSTPLPQMACASLFTPTIDGYSQSGSLANTAAQGFNAIIPVVLDGSGVLAPACGLDFPSSGGGYVTVSGMEIRNFTFGGSGYGLCGSVHAFGNRLLNNTKGIFAYSGSMIGDPSNAGRNVFGGNSAYGIYVSYGGSPSITNNFIGTLDGTTASPNMTAIYMPGSAGSITGNVVSGNLGEGIYLSNDNGSTVSNNKVGTDATGSAPLVNSGTGIYCNYCFNTSITFNLVSGNSPGISLANVTGLTVTDNKVGTNFAANAAIPNADGILAYCGTTLSIHRNVVSGNVDDGIRLSGIQNSNLFSNKIGVAGDGVSAIGNGGDGIQIAFGACTQTSNLNTIYGSTIANNSANGVLLAYGTGNDVQESSIYANGFKNININNTVGPLPNDPGDIDTGPNNQQNYPVITSVVQAGGNTTVFYTLDTDAPSTLFQVHFYSNPAPGVPAGRSYRDNPNITTDASGQFSGSRTFTGLYDNISATATNKVTRDVSEFSAIVSVTGAPAVSLSATSLDFSFVPTGSTSPTQSVTVSSVGSAPYQINTFDSSPACSGGPICSGGDFTCSTTCAPLTLYASGMSCQVSASFHPALLGPQSTTIYLCDNAPGSPHSITLTGNGITPPPIIVSPNSFDFGNALVGARSGPHTFTFSNPGSADVDIGPVSTQGDFVVDSTNCGATVPAGNVCSAIVTFVPTQPGLASGFVYLLPGAPKAAKFTLASAASLFGTGVQFAQLQLPSTVDVGAYVLGAPPISRTVELRNSGNAVLSFSSIAAGAPFTATHDCPANLAPGASCTVNIGFSATATGEFRGTLTVVSNAQGGSRSIPLTARAQPVAAPVVHVAPTFIGYGNRMFGTQSDAQRITVTNDGGAPAALSGLSVGLDYVVVTTSCGTTLASLASCTADVAFRPFGFGPRPGQFTLNSNSADSPHSVNLLGTGCRPFTVSGRGGASSTCAP